VICAGLGTTGTSALDRALGTLGMTTAKWTHVTHQPSNVHVASQIMRPLLGNKYVAGMFDAVDAILDSPAIDHLPWILEDYPASKVILTVRDPKQWAKRRRQSHPCSAPPFRTWYMPYKLHPCRPSDELALEHAYIAWCAYVRAICAQRDIPLLELDLFKRPDVELWSALETFLGRTRTNSTIRFGAGS
jgi:hypothetical protein